MLWGAFTNSSEAMSAFSWGMGTISQNIANVNTDAYKRKDTEFKTMLSEGHAATADSAPLNVFGVKPADRTAISVNGNIKQTGNWADLAINGRGFFMVAQPNSTVSGGQITNSPPSTISFADNNSIYYTRDGAFTEQVDGQGRNYLTTSSGQYVLGWQADSQGNISSGAAVTPIYIQAYTMDNTTNPPTLKPTVDGVATTKLTPAMNVPSNLPMTKSSQSFSNLSLTDPYTGDAHALTSTWTRAGADTWNVSFSLPSGVGTVATDPTTTPATNSLTVTLDQNGNVVSPTGTAASQVGLYVDWASNPGTWTDPTTFPSQTADITGQKPSYSTASVSMTVYDSQYNAHTVAANFEHMGNDQWTLHIDPQPDGTIANGTGSILLNFDGSGNITGVSQTDPVTGATTTSATDQATSTIVWNNAALGSSPLTFDLTHLTQLEGDKPSIKSVDQDGFAAGTYSYARFDGAGKLSAFYSNGHSKVIFQVPVASFTAPDSLNPVSGNLFQRTPQAGSISVGSVEDQGSGAAITAGALESSNVNLENEFTKMIITQRAYSSNATVFKTADEMTQTTRDLYR